MTSLSQFNQVYNSDAAVQLRKEISDLNYNIQYLQIRASQLNEDLVVKINEYETLLGVKKDGENAKK